MGAGTPAWHALDAGGVLRAIASDVAFGLSGAEAATRLSRHGRNDLPAPARPAPALVFLRQFRSPLIYLLLAAAGISTALRELADAAVILVVVVLNACIGAAQEIRAQRSLEKLWSTAGQEARVVRGGRTALVPAGEIVPGDVLLVEAGETVAADARLIDASALRVVEAALTGESLPVGKDAAPVAPGTPAPDRTCMLHAGTLVAAGRGRAVGDATGRSTVLGGIAALAGAATQPKTPLERRIARFGRQVLAGSLAAFAAIVALGLLRGVPAGQIVLLGISEMVSAVPEGLPVAVTIALAVGVQRMARRRAIVRRLSAVETLGSTTVICTDKTGTLTRNEMMVTAIALPGRAEIAIEGTGYAPEGAFVEAGSAVQPDEDLLALLRSAALCNDAEVLPPAGDPPRWRAAGDPTEAALVSAAAKAGVDVAALRASFPRRAEIPFDPATRIMAVEHDGAGGPFVEIKGAPEPVLELCGAFRRSGRIEPLDGATRDAIRRSAASMGERALRVLAVATVRGPIGPQGTLAPLAGHAVLLGLVGQSDPPRPEVAGAVRKCRDAGIRPVVVSGDHVNTACAVAASLGIRREGDTAVDGRQLDAMDDDALVREAPHIAVFARVQPEQKLRIVRAFQRLREIVAMTGDGVNDAPALASADVGVAMGSGTDVAKDAARIVITDDDFATIVAAVEEGRVVRRNVKKAILLLLTTSAAEVLLLVLSLAAGLPPPLTAVQILWNNLLSEGAVTINLVMDPPEGDEMREAPPAAGEPLVDRTLLARMALLVPASVLATLGWFAARILAGTPLATAQSETLVLLTVSEWYNVLNCRSARKSALSTGLLSNRWLVGGLLAGNLLLAAVIYWPPLQRAFHTVPVGATEAIAIAVVASLVVWVEELRKWRARLRTARP